MIANDAEPGVPKSSATGTRTRVARVRAEYPNQLDYSGVYISILLFSTTELVLLLGLLISDVRRDPVHSTGLRLDCHWIATGLRVECGKNAGKVLDNHK